MRRALTVLAVSVAIVVPAHADVMTGDYVAPPGGAFTDTVAGHGIGGYIFAAGGKPLKIRVHDETGNTVSIRVCQDIDRDKNCENPEEFKVCAHDSVTYDIPQTNKPWNTTTPIAVFVRSGDTACDGVLATAGTITLTTTT